MQIAGRELLDLVESATDPATAIAMAHGRMMHAGLELAQQVEPQAKQLAATILSICFRLLEAETHLQAPAELPLVEVPLDVQSYPIERCAALAAAIDLTPSGADRCLQRDGLDGETWRRLEMHWEEAMDNESRSGRRELVERYDGAYVEQLEGERGAISIDDYARLKVATTRGTQRSVVRELGLPAAAIIKIDRQWISKIAGDAGLRMRVRRAVEQQRLK